LEILKERLIDGIKEGDYMRYEKTAYRLREALDENNMSQQELADKSKIGKKKNTVYTVSRRGP